MANGVDPQRLIRAWSSHVEEGEWSPTFPSRQMPVSHHRRSETKGWSQVRILPSTPILLTNVSTLVNDAFLGVLDGFVNCECQLTRHHTLEIPSLDQRVFSFMFVKQRLYVALAR